MILADVNALPEAPVVAWIDGTAYPGASGNMVLYGYYDGPNQTFLRLHELDQGDEFDVVTAGTEGKALRYRVESVIVTSAGDLSLLAPTTDPRATLITDVPGSPEKRTAVTATLVR